MATIRTIKLLFSLNILSTVHVDPKSDIGDIKLTCDTIITTQPVIYQMKLRFFSNSVLSQSDSEMMRYRCKLIRKL